MICYPKWQCLSSQFFYFFRLLENKIIFSPIKVSLRNNYILWWYWAELFIHFQIVSSFIPVGRWISLASGSRTRFSRQHSIALPALCSLTNSCLTLYVSIDCSLSSSTVHGIFQARILERVAISRSKGSSKPRNRIWVSCAGKSILYHWATWKALLWIQFDIMEHYCISP